MLQAFVFEGIAVLVFPWWEPVDPPERGARVEVRLRTAEPARGSYAAAQRIVIDEPLFRADLFDHSGAPPGNLRKAHFHPSFDDVEPTDRVWPRELKADPCAWLTSELTQLDALVARGGGPLDAPWLEADAAALRLAVPTIVDAVRSAWEVTRADGRADFEVVRPGHPD